jgi:hypothetical protein
MPTFAISSFVRRQTYESEFSYFQGSDEELLRLVEMNFDLAIPGYREGVVLVPVPPTNFVSGIAILEEGDELVGTFKARRPGELPVKEVRVDKYKSPAMKVDVVLYAHHVLVENDEHSSDADWEIISINARPTFKEQPITPGALMRNYFQEKGGTDTKMTPEEFVEALRVSREYWRDKCLVVPLNSKGK